MESPSLRVGTASSFAQPRVPSSVFEGLFIRGLAPHGALARALVAEGYDPRCPEMDYPIGVWKRCVIQARRMVYGELNDADAHRLLGRKLCEGFSETLVGRVAAVALPMIGPARVMERLPRYFAMMGRPDIEFQLVVLNDRERRVCISDVHNRPEFVAGSMEVALERAHVQPIIHVDDRSPQGFRLLVRW
ncbi:DUF2378 family protein [Melittangium boletus]|uniref:DUF2378 family protein n=1 Tax=Melittangium boletus DSM 14713 TaxID=1294270 RepID=A0A250IB01_9BACT|nr:DUF2378 family protein [Melittangium boletus]ATB28321.1 hypothetical protein MEBOL_001767 [Melittangium boletus DSM 14713]